MLPFSTEEVWSWWHEGSMHRSPWPVARPLREACGANDAAASAEGANLLVAAGSALAALRKIKSDAKVSQRTEIPSVDLLVPEAQVGYVEAAKADLMAAGRVRDLAIVGVPDGGDAVIATRGAELVPSEG